MNAHLPERVSYTLEELQIRWRAGSEDMRQWLVHGILSAHVWLPVMSVFRIREKSEGNARKQIMELCHWEGHTMVSRHSCYRLFRRERIYLREFTCADLQECYSLPDTADDISISLHDLVILRDECTRFETTHRIGNSQAKQTNDSDLPHGYFDTGFKTLSYAGRDYVFGDIQSSILRQLHEAAMTGEPWCSGKRLLAHAGSQSFTLSNIFKRNPVWREIILSDGRGAYRMNGKFMLREKN